MSKFCSVHHVPYLTSSLQELKIRGKLFPVDGKPRIASISTRCDGERRFPCPEFHFTGASTQSFIHNFTVTVRDGRYDYTFVVFLKRHCRLSNNQSIPSCQGDVLVMKLGKEGKVVNLNGRDSALASFVATW